MSAPPLVVVLQSRSCRSIGRWRGAFESVSLSSSLRKQFCIFEENFSVEGHFRRNARAQNFAMKLCARNNYNTNTRMALLCILFIRLGAMISCCAGHDGGGGGGPAKAQQVLLRKRCADTMRFFFFFFFFYFSSRRQGADCFIYIHAIAQ